MAIEGSTQLGQRPGQPQTLTSSVNGQNILLQWAPPTTGDAPTSYVVEAGSAPNASNLASFSTGSAATSVAAQAPPGVYYVRVRARNSAGIGPSSNEIAVAVGNGCNLPPPPSNLSVSVSGPNVTLNWIGAGSLFLVEAGSAPGISNLATAAVAGTNPTFTGVPPGRYYVRVKARNACGLSTPSNEIIVDVR